MHSHYSDPVFEYYQRKQKEARANEIEAIKRKYSDAPYMN
jgi:hypothetical protein